MECTRCEGCGHPAQPGQEWCSTRCYDRLYSRARRLKSGKELHKEREPTYRGVLGLDGEGIDGRYTLLAASNGQYIENYKTGLSTRECFEWLLALDPKPLKWGFAFGYDVNMMLRDLDRNYLERLQEHGRTYWAEYQIQHFSGKLFRVRNRKTGKSVSIWDLYPFIQSSFVKFLTKFELATPKEIDRIAGMKDLRSDFATVDPKQIRSYCISECQYLERGVTHFLELFTEMGYRTNAYYSPGTIAALEFRKQGILEFYEPPADDVQEMVEKAYYGGRAECSTVGPIEGTFHQYDINSAYPYAATLLPCLSCGHWEPSTDLHPHGVYRVRWQAPTGTVWGPLPWRPRTGSLKYPTEGTSHVWGIELLSCTVPFDIVSGFRWVQRCDHQPFDYLSSMYYRRTELKRQGDGREYVMKLILNSSYGKLAQRSKTMDGKIPRYQCLAWAGMITATVRAILAEQLQKHPDDIVMVATDSLLSRRKLDLPVNDTLGGWSVVQLNNLFVVGAGFLFCESGLESVSRTRGVRPADIRYDDLLAAWNRDGREGSYPATVNRFIGYGMMLQRIGGEDLWRKFWRSTLQKRFSMFPRRIWQIADDVYDGRTVAPALMDCKGTEILDGFTDLRRDLSDGGGNLGALLVALGQRNGRDSITDQPDWIVDGMTV